MQLGFNIQPQQNNQFQITQTPADFTSPNIVNDIEKILESYQYAYNDQSYNPQDKLYRSYALKKAIKVGQTLSTEQMQELLYTLFNACPNPYQSPNLLNNFYFVNKDSVDKWFGF